LKREVAQFGNPPQFPVAEPEPEKDAKEAKEDENEEKKDDKKKKKVCSIELGFAISRLA
jgi:hypothetical protein